MNIVKVTGILLIIAGILGLAYGGFTYIKASHKASLGPVDLVVNDKQTVLVPTWAGVGAIVIGGLLLLYRKNSG
ncbi:MAG: hypothetical protein HGA76_05910 [Candidatus Firestonebacteria bacterium]|nr:hypothetical protein [Candidatus Firestonebacteria bacterium]